MTCERCQGLMVRERICDLQGTSVDLCVESFRCLLCGNVVDPMIIENRRRSSETVEPLMASSPRMPGLATA